MTQGQTHGVLVHSLGKDMEWAADFKSCTGY